jgi:hypothetical protein
MKEIPYLDLRKMFLLSLLISLLQPEQEASWTAVTTGCHIFVHSAAMHSCPYIFYL